MHQSPLFAQRDEQAFADLIDQHPFATLISCGDGTADVNHVPLIRWSNESGQPVLTGHFARGNSDWERLDGRPVIAVFHGPHAYISPRWYGVQNSVPTWNYLVVHVHGRAKLVTDQIAVLARLEQLRQHLEPDNGWTFNNPEPGFVEKLTAGIVAFDITIERMEGTWKLSQHHDAARRRRTVTGLREHGSADSRGIADWMERIGPMEPMA